MFMNNGLTDSTSGKAFGMWKPLSTQAQMSIGQKQAEETGTLQPFGPPDPICGMRRRYRNGTTRSTEYYTKCSKVRLHDLLVSK